jgi:hypothetical protein
LAELDCHRRNLHVLEILRSCQGRQASPSQAIPTSLYVALPQNNYRKDEVNQMMYAMAIFGIVVLAIFVLGILVSSLLMFPDFLRYMKMKSM